MEAGLDELKRISARIWWERLCGVVPNVGRIAAFTRALHTYILEPGGPTAERAKAEYQECMRHAE